MEGGRDGSEQTSKRALSLIYVVVPDDWGK